MFIVLRGTPENGISILKMEELRLKITGGDFVLFEKIVTFDI